MKPQDGRCFNCGAKDHSKPDCPYPKKASGSRKGSVVGNTGGQPKGQDGDGDPKQKRAQLDGFMTDLARSVQMVTNASTHTHDPMVRICRLAKCDEGVDFQEEPAAVRGGAISDLFHTPRVCSCRWPPT